MGSSPDLLDLRRVLLNMARSKEFPAGSSRHGYDFISPLDADGHIDPTLWKKYRDYCRVRRFWDGEEDELGWLVHRPCGPEHARWMFAYDQEDPGHDEAGYRFGVHAFVPGEYVSVSGRDGKVHTFRVASVAPLILSVQLVSSFGLEITF